MPIKNKQTWQKVLLSLVFVMPFSIFGAQSDALQSNSPNPLRELENSIANKRFEDAYQIALALENELEGDPKFDFLLGLAAQKSQDWQRAIYAFERILITQPGDPNARYALAVSYYELNNLDASEVEFSQLSSINLPPALADSVSLYLQAIERRKQALQEKFRSWIGADLGYDDNPNSGVDETLLTLPTLGQVLIFEESRQHSSGFVQAHGKIQYSAPLNQRASWLASASVRHINFSNSLSFDRTFANLNLGYQTQMSGVTMQASGFFRTLQLDGDGFIDIIGTNLGVHYPLSTQSKIGSNLILTKESHKQQDRLDKQTGMLDVWFQRLSKIGIHTVSLKFGQDSGDVQINDLTSRDLYGAGYRWQYTHSTQWLYKVDINYFRADYDNQNPIFLMDREDTFLRAQFEAKYAWSDKLAISANLIHINNDSDLVIYKYNRTKVSLGVHYEF